MSECYRCRDPIEWVVTAKGRRQALNPGDPGGARGNVVLVDDDVAEYIHDGERDAFRGDGWEVREAHAATCRGWATAPSTRVGGG